MGFVEAVTAIVAKQAQAKPGEIRVHCRRAYALSRTPRILTVSGLRVLVNGDAPSPADVESEEWK